MPFPAAALGCALLTAVPPGPASLGPLVGLSAERLAVADRVAAAKFGTGRPIDDPVRERQILDEVAGRSARAGVDPVRAVAIFRDQIEAGKLVQRALFRRWTAHPDRAPKTRPDLDTEVRPALDRLTVEILDAVRTSGKASAGPSCRPRLAAEVTRAGRALDAPHRAALVRAVASVCVPR
ncbi:chorismate mutase [Actinomadura kijaniata]|uniref:chorismate mutase n=1 Tax=Actinomadura namibiensis TaxID=182080 RepID=A0A7W3QRI2_ACTNM|nr:chorismate mutase [Actinomadura namibiensis]MBA8956726.1 chorismate mutase [Actinomadura namibiensis]